MFHLIAVELWLRTGMGADFAPHRHWATHGLQGRPQFEGNYWCPAGGGQGRWPRTCRGQVAPTKEHSLIQSVHNPEVEDPWFRVILEYFVPTLGVPKDVTYALRERRVAP